jgi:hypothetical protein
VKSNSKASKGNENKSKMAAARPKKVTAVGGKSLTKKKHQTATKATRIPKKRQQLPRHAESPSSHLKYVKRISFFQ